MKTAIVYASVHLGNTKKVVDAIKNECDLEVIDATKEPEKDLSEYDLIGFVSGIYAGKYHQAVLKFAEVNLPENKDVFFLFTSAMGNKNYDKTIKEATASKKPNIKGSLSVRAMTTFGPFKLIGGVGKGRPNENDLKNAVDFVKKMMA